MIKILITSACAVTSRSIARGLKIDNPNEIYLIGIDIFENNFAVFENLYDEFYKVPKFTNIHYPQKVKEIIKKRKIDVALIVPEKEVKIWSKLKFNIKCLIPSSKFINHAAGKSDLYRNLSKTKFMPKSIFVKKHELDKIEYSNIRFPAWVRPCHFGVTSGFDAKKINNKNDLIKHIKKKSNYNEWQIAEFIKGKNIAVNLLIKKNRVLNYGMYERIEYFASNLIESKISGNISKGKIFTNKNLLINLKKILKILAVKNNLVIEGLITVDLILPNSNIPKLTEINIRPTAPIEAYSHINNKILINWVEAALGKTLSPSQYAIPKDTYILRDIDGKLQVIDNMKKKLKLLINNK
jgi:predicted ATP-grasp superfamily ATP-dependent carboligase